MCPQVMHEVRFLRESAGAQITVIRSLASVYVEVPGQVATRGEDPAAVGASDRLSTDIFWVMRAASVISGE